MAILNEIKNLLVRILIILISLSFFIAPSFPILANSINYEQTCRSYFSFDLKFTEETNLSTNQNLKDAVTVWQFTCKSENDLVDYRNWAMSVGQVAAKGASQLSTRFVSTSKGLTDLQPTLSRIASGGKFPHRNDDSIFKNLEGLLPKQNTGFYREFVHPIVSFP